MQLVPITTKVVSLNPIHGEVYSIQHYVIKFVSDFRQVGDFLLVLLQRTALVCIRDDKESNCGNIPMYNYIFLLYNIQINRFMSIFAIWN